jgi:hypothetical protein
MLSLLLTLVATPVAYSLFDDAAQWMQRRVGRKEQASVTGEVVVPVLRSVS